MIACLCREVILHGRRDNRAWFEPGVEVIPPRDPSGISEVFVVAKSLTGNDIGPLFFLRTCDLGRTWSPPALSLGWHKIPLADDLFEEPWFVPYYHRPTGRLTALGNTHFVRDSGGSVGQKNEHHVRDAGLLPSMVYSLWNDELQDFEPWKRLEGPNGVRLGIYYGSQKHTCADGSILVPGYYNAGPDRQGCDRHRNVTVLRLSFDGSDFRCLEHGSVNTVEEARGLAEPSLIHCQDRYFLTIRHDERGYVAVSDDGLQFHRMKPWAFDDGADLGNYSTQQHWLKHRDRLYLVYNRRSDLNNGVFRSRAPLFMAEVDLDRICVIRDSEQIVFPEKGARMGNFCIADIDPTESWIITGEWLEGKFSHSREGDRFYIENPAINYLQYIGTCYWRKSIGKHEILQHFFRSVEGDDWVMLLGCLPVIRFRRVAFYRKAGEY